MPDDPATIPEAVDQIRRSYADNLDPALLAHLEQLYAVWRESMAHNGVLVDENAIHAVMGTCTMIADARLVHLARMYGLAPEDLMIAVLGASLGPGRFEP